MTWLVVLIISTGATLTTIPQPNHAACQRTQQQLEYGLQVTGHTDAKWTCQKAKSA